MTNGDLDADKKMFISSSNSHKFSPKLSIRFQILHFNYEAAGWVMIFEMRCTALTYRSLHNRTRYNCFLTEY